MQSDAAADASEMQFKTIPMQRHATKVLCNAGKMQGNAGSGGYCWAHLRTHPPLPSVGIAQLHYYYEDVISGRSHWTEA